MSLMNRKYSADIKGVLSIEDGKIIVSVEDIGDVDLADFVKDFVDKEDVKITISYGEQLA